MAARRRRYEEALQKRNTTCLRCDFVATPDLGLREWREEEVFDVVTSMFAIHYFFVSEQALKQVLTCVLLGFLGMGPNRLRLEREALKPAGC